MQGPITLKIWSLYIALKLTKNFFIFVLKKSYRPVIWLGLNGVDVLI